MARKSRKLNAAAALTVPQEKIYRTAIYVRLSHEDERKVESDSVENQIALLQSFVEGRPEFRVADQYVDVDWTGTNFKRPEFQRMITDMKAGKIDCIIVKDLSRLGRNYLEAGDYIEKIFPFFGVRFIAVTDNYDSLTSEPTEDGLIVPLKNLINEAYAKDISRKISSAYESKFKAGIYTASCVPYGFQRVEGDTSALAVDEAVRPVIVRIYNEYIGGKSLVGLARELNAEGIPSPTQHSIETGERKSKTNATSRWMVLTLREIMRNPAYIGDVEMGAGRQMLYKGISFQKMAKEDRYYVRDHHEAIVSREVFEAAQKKMEATNKAYRDTKDVYPAEAKNTREALLKGVLYCGDCRHPMYMRRRTRKIKSGYGHYSNYTCSRSGIYENDPKKYWNADKAEATVAELIRVHIALFMDAADRMKALNRKPEAADHRKALEKQIQEAEDRKQKVAGIMQNLYSDFADGLFSEEEYLDVKKGYIEEADELDKRQQELKKALTEYDLTYSGNPEMSAAFRKFEGFEELTADVVKTFIRRIYYYSDDRIEVEYTFQDEMKAFLDRLKAREAGV